MTKKPFVKPHFIKQMLQNIIFSVLKFFRLYNDPAPSACSEAARRNNEAIAVTLEKYVSFTHSFICTNSLMLPCWYYRKDSNKPFVVGNYHMPCMFKLPVRSSLIKLIIFNLLTHSLTHSLAHSLTHSVCHVDALCIICEICCQSSQWVTLHDYWRLQHQTRFIHVQHVHYGQKWDGLTRGTLLTYSLTLTHSLLLTHSRRSVIHGIQYHAPLIH